MLRSSCPKSSCTVGGEHVLPAPFGSGIRALASQHKKHISAPPNRPAGRRRVRINLSLVASLPSRLHRKLRPMPHGDNPVRLPLDSIEKAVGGNYELTVGQIGKFRDFPAGLREFLTPSQGRRGPLSKTCRCVGDYFDGYRLMPTGTGSGPKALLTLTTRSTSQSSTRSNRSN